MITHCSRCIAKGTPRTFMATISGLEAHNLEFHVNEKKERAVTEKRTSSNPIKAAMELLENG